MKLGASLLCMALASSVSAAGDLRSAYQEWLHGRAPETPWSFPSLADAAAHGCRGRHVLDPACESCVLPRTAGQDGVLVLYEAGGDGTMALREIVPIPTWYARMEVECLDLTGSGQEIVLVEMVGNHGTSVHHDLLLGLTWRHGAVMPLLLETTTYGEGCCGVRTELEATPIFQNVGTPGVALQLLYTYERTTWGGEGDGFEHAAWNERLVFSPERSSFYDPRREAVRSQAEPFHVRRNIAWSRWSLGRIHADNLFEELLGSTGALGILDGERPGDVD